MIDHQFGVIFALCDTFIGSIDSVSVVVSQSFIHSRGWLKVVVGVEAASVEREWLRVPEPCQFFENLPKGNSCLPTERTRDTRRGEIDPEDS